MRAFRTILALSLPLISASSVRAEPGASPRASQATDAAAPRQAERDSLQKLLERLRVQRDGVFSTLRNQIEVELRQMGEHALARDTDALEQDKQRLIALGSEAAPLLVDAIEPGAQGSDAHKLRAQYVVLALAALRANAITPRLIDMTQEASVEARQNAVTLLGYAPDRERAASALIGVYRGSDVGLREHALTALARAGGDAANGILSDALASADAAVVGTALSALGRAGNSDLAPRIVRLMSIPADGARYIDPLLAYFRAVPDAADKASLLALVRLAGEESAPLDARVRLLAALPAFQERFDADTRKELKTLAESKTAAIRDGALVALVLSGDKQARRTLLATYDEQIVRMRESGQAYLQRADVLYRIGDYKEAQKDYNQSIKQYTLDEGTARADNAFIGLARCYAMTGKLREAAQTLEKAPLSLRQLGELARDPAFQKLVENPKYRDTFRDAR